jgi:TIR domain-containing protein
MNEIFLSYRRADEPGTTGRLFDHLVKAFDRPAIFYDVDKIPHGTDFQAFIDQTIRNCRVVLVVIGPAWLEMKDENGRRLDQLNDPVRIEIETALRHRKRIIPVLIDDARMPDAAQLPGTIEQLVSQNAAPMHNNQYFEQDINTLINDIASMGVQRKVQGPIINPPSANLPTLTRRQTAAIVGLPLILISLGLVAVIAIGYFGYTFISNNNPFGLGHTATNGAHKSFNDFCSALSQSDYTTAYSYLTEKFQVSVGGATTLAVKLTTDFANRPVKVTSCHPFVNSGTDGFYVENGNTASDKVEFDATLSDGSGAQETVFGTMYFVKDGTTWKLDRFQQGG